MADVNRTAYKRLAEEFVSGHSGTTTLEIALVASSAPISVLLRNVIIGVLVTHRPNLPERWRILIDFSCTVLPTFGCVTVLSDYVAYVLISMLMCTILITTLHHQFREIHRDDFKEKKIFNYILDLAVVGKKPFVTNFRAFANIATAVCILAVDFTIFPRRFCKTETYGTGLMDVAVGGFVIANSIVSPEARGKHPIQRPLHQRLTGILKTFKSTIPLWILGICRLASVKGLDYQEHVSEYGVHWNFFFTLALVKVMSSLVLSIFDPNVSWLIAIVIASGYEYLLSGLNYRQYVLHGADGLDSRRSFLEANREGIFSSLGYCAISFAGMQLGRFLWQPRSKLREWVRCALLLTLADVAFWVLLAYTETHMVPVSRRIANLPYILWIMAYSLHIVAAFLVVDILCVILQETTMVKAVLHGHGTGGRQKLNICLLEAVNRNGLFYFLFANVLTGATNMVMQTVRAAYTTGLLILVGYMLTLSLVSIYLHKKNITLKFW